MAVSFSRKSTLVFERRVKHLAWFALVASIALLMPAMRMALTPDLALAVGLGALVLVVAVWRVVVAVPRHLREQQARAYELAQASHQDGACQTAAAIQDRVANLLSVTVGYAEFLVDDPQLPAEARERAQHALDGALAAARVVSTFKEALGCHGRGPLDAAELTSLRRVSVAGTTARLSALRRAAKAHPHWRYDDAQRTIKGPDGASIATLAPRFDAAQAAANGHLLAEAPALWQALAATQQVGVKVLVDAQLKRELAVELRDLLDRINELTEHLDGAIDPG